MTLMNKVVEANTQNNKYFSPSLSSLLNPPPPLPKRIAHESATIKKKKKKQNLRYNNLY
jgi:hypothetical protein